MILLRMNVTTVLQLNFQLKQFYAYAQNYFYATPVHAKNNYKSFTANF